MTFDLSCLNNHPSLPLVPSFINDSSLFVHSNYKPNSGSISQLISASLARSTFSINDVEVLLRDLFHESLNSWDISKIIKQKPITSAIIYLSVTIVLFLIFSLIFCVISCCNYKSYQAERKLKTNRIYVFLLFIILLLGIADMGYVAYRIHNSKTSIHDAIQEFNGNIYPKAVSEDLKYISQQLEQLDRYFIKPDSILINASKSMLVKTFDGILNDKYFSKNISQSINSFSSNFNDLTHEIASLTIPPSAMDIFHHIQKQYNQTIISVQIPLKEVCNYANGQSNDIDKILLNALNLVHVQLIKFINTINQDILNEMTPWQNHVLINKNLEKEILRYNNIVGTIFFVLVILFGFIPFIIFLLISVSRACCHKKTFVDDRNSIAMKNVGSKNRFNNQHNTKVSSNKGSSKITLCLIRFSFVIMTIMMIVMILLTGVYYASDLIVQGVCRTAHDDRSTLIDILSEQLVKSNTAFKNASEISEIITNVIRDCRDQIHFSRRFLESYWSDFEFYVKDMMNTLSKQIYDQFITSIAVTNTTGSHELLGEFFNQTNLTTISPIIQRMFDDLNTMNSIFTNITTSNSTLSTNFVETTISQFENYLRTVVELTIDACPLPLATIYQTDKLVCHTMGNSINGLWLSVFIFIFLIMCIFCVFGIHLYQKLSK